MQNLLWGSSGSNRYCIGVVKKPEPFNWQGWLEASLRHPITTTLRQVGGGLRLADKGRRGT